jgi:predicted CXXCH cytochrome family protein
MHKDRADCTACHNPHVGKDSRLLKVELEESW